MLNLYDRFIEHFSLDAWKFHLNYIVKSILTHEGFYVKYAFSVVLLQCGKRSNDLKDKDMLDTLDVISCLPTGLNEFVSVCFMRIVFKNFLTR